MHSFWHVACDSWQSARHFLFLTYDITDQVVHLYLERPAGSWRTAIFFLDNERMLDWHLHRPLSTSAAKSFSLSFDGRVDDEESTPPHTYVHTCPWCTFAPTCSQAVYYIKLYISFNFLNDCDWNWYVFPFWREGGKCMSSFGKDLLFCVFYSSFQNSFFVWFLQNIYLHWSILLWKLRIQFWGLYVE